MDFNKIINDNKEEFEKSNLINLNFELTERYTDTLISKAPKEGKNLLLLSIQDANAILSLCEKLKYENIFVIDTSKKIAEFTAYIGENKKFSCMSAGEVNIKSDMTFDLIIANPPFKLGNKVITKAISHLSDNGVASVLMPLHCYKKNDLYRYVETFELANPKLFEDAEIGMNLCITTCKKTEINKYSWPSLVIESLDPKYKLAYEYNILHFDEYKLYPTQKVYVTKDDLDVKTDFIDSSRVFSSSHGAIPSFRKQSDCYKYNTQYDESCINKGILVIKFTSEKAKQNYCKFAYNYETLEERNTHLCGKLMKGLRIVSAAQEYYFFIPQIDWSSIHINQKELWDKGLYDEAVLSEMHLKWNNDKTKIIQA